MITTAAIFVLFFATQSERAAHAGFLKDVGRVVTAPVTIPAEVGKRILQRDNPLEAVHGPFQSAGRVIQRGTDAFQRAQDTFVGAQRDLIRNNLGPDWVRGYDMLTASQRVQHEMGLTAGRFLGRCLQGQPCDIQELQAAPLAAAMRDAYKAYIGHAVPLDPQLVRVLSYVVPGQVLVAARMTVSEVPDFTTIPGFLNAANEAGGSGHAVVLANLMIFSRQIDLSNWDDWNWLLHELFHIEQYMRYSTNTLESIDGFAVNYMQHYNSTEDEAQNAADHRLGRLQQICQVRC
jgi:hypothetical protein